MKKFIPLLLLGILVSCASMNEKQVSEHGFTYARIPASVVNPVISTIKAIKGGEQAAVKLINESRAAYGLSKAITNLDEIAKDPLIIRSLRSKALLGEFGTLSPQARKEIAHTSEIYENSESLAILGELTASAKSKNAALHALGSKGRGARTQSQAVDIIAEAAIKSGARESYAKGLAKGTKVRILDDPQNSAFYIAQLDQALEQDIKTGGNYIPIGVKNQCENLGKKGELVYYNIMEEVGRNISSTTTKNDYLWEVSLAMQKVINGREISRASITDDMLRSLNDEFEFRKGLCKSPCDSGASFCPLGLPRL